MTKNTKEELATIKRNNLEEIEGIMWIRWWPMWNFSTHSLDSVQVEVLLGFQGPHLISTSEGEGGDQDMGVQEKEDKKIKKYKDKRKKF